MDYTKYIEEAKQLFMVVAEKIGEGAEFGWMVVIKQQYVYGYRSLFIAFVTACSMIAGYKLIKHGMKISKEDRYDGDAFCAIGMMLMSVAGIVFIASSLCAISYLSNPEYYALDYFFNLVKPVTNQ